MLPNTLRFKGSSIKSSRSKIKFYGNFKGELDKLMTRTEESIETEFGTNYGVDSIVASGNNIKIRIYDEAHGISQIIHCVFRYDREDEKRGEIHIEINSQELSEKIKTHHVGTFQIKEGVKIHKKLLEDLRTCMQVIQ